MRNKRDRAFPIFAKDTFDNFVPHNTKVEVSILKEKLTHLDFRVCLQLNQRRELLYCGGFQILLREEACA